MLVRWRGESKSGFEGLDATALMSMHCQLVATVPTLQGWGVMGFALMRSWDEHASKLLYICPASRRRFRMKRFGTCSKALQRSGLPSMIEPSAGNYFSATSNFVRSP